MLGLCHDAPVDPVAVKTCPDVGAVASLIVTVVVADFNAVAGVGSCHVALVEAVAVKTCPKDGAVAVAALIVVVADFKPVEIIDVDVNVDVFVPSVSLIVLASRTTGYNRLYASSTNKLFVFIE